MGFLDKAKDLAGQHPDQADKLVDKAGDAFDAKTDGKFSQHTDTAQGKAGEFLKGDQAAPAAPEGEGEQPPA